MTDKVSLEWPETAKLEGKAVCLRDRLLIRLPRKAGCRISEVLALEVDDIDFNEKKITIEHLKARLQLSCPDCGTRLGKSHSFCPGCGGKVSKVVEKEKEFRRLRTVPIDSDTLEMLRRYIDGGGPRQVNGRVLLFNLTRQRAWQIYIECARRAGLPRLKNPDTGRWHNVTAHRMRDAFATRWAKIDSSTDSMRMLQEMLGHKDIGTTMKYRKVAGKELEDRYSDIMGEKG